MKPPEKISRSRLKYYSRFSEKKYRNEEHKFLVEGAHLVEEAVKSAWNVEAIIISRCRESLSLGSEAKDIPIFTATDREMGNLTETVTTQGIVAVVEMKVYPRNYFWKSLRKGSVIVALDGISDPGNAGTILRACDWFGVDGVIMSGDSVDLYSPKVVRSAMGAVFHLPVIRKTDLRLMILEARKHGLKAIAAVHRQGKPLHLFSFPDRSLLIFGNEAHGISGEILKVSDERLTIPRYGMAESLNVAMSCGIILNSLRASSG